jgi:hypothetical protein
MADQQQRAERLSLAADEAASLLREVCAFVNAVRESLQKPAISTLRESWPVLESAIAGLRTLNQLLNNHNRQHNAGLHDSALELHRGVLQLGVLLESSGHFALGRAYSIGMMLAGYTSVGTPSPLDGPRRTLVDG